MPAFQEGFINVGENDEYPNLITDPSMEDLLDGMNFSLAGGGGDSGFSTMGDNATSVLLELPDEMKFGNKNVLVIVAYVNLMWISLLGNSIVLGKLFYRKNRSRVHFMLLHLCIADLLVTVIEMPLQIVWKSTVQWRAGDALCRLLGGLRVVGLYLSAFILIAISIDRFMSVWDPLSTVTRATCRAKVMVFTAWFLSFACASPQLTVWSLRTHPQFTWYQQCVTFEAFSSHSAEMAYGLWISLLMYGFPLITIIICYLGIWLRISYYSKQTQQQGPNVTKIGKVRQADRVDLNVHVT
ncbi:putative Gonadotropin-releasing hormone II receptor [Hypsibius exemplaris]|uniref:Gonadotropin-releasing hormone II receptor n=1 Tax=Hypsibius exemplaris TaxID=2072580 RepID=A0A1W0WD34_HYPEX|nr:putative Gonadotropin-releasing hormone II receptor [Hypsibius exemplaris]